MTRPVAEEIVAVIGISYTPVSRCYMLSVTNVAAQFAMVAVVRKPCSSSPGMVLEAAQWNLSESKMKVMTGDEDEKGLGVRGPGEGETELGSSSEFMITQFVSGRRQI